MREISHAELLYRIALAIGEGLNLEQMLRTALLTLLRVLNCNAALVLQQEELPREGMAWRAVSAIPRQDGEHGPFPDLARLLPANTWETADFRRRLPLAQPWHNQTLHLFALPDYGLLALRRSSPLPPDLCRSLLPLFRKLSLAARACLHEERLQEQTRAAEAASIAKSRFLANVSHEIRTPMNAVIGMSELLINSGLDQRQQRYAEVIRTSTESLLGLINNILDLSKIEAGRLEVEAVPLTIRELLAEVVDLLAARAEEKGLRLSSRVAPAVPERLRGDPGRIRQVLLNLTDNAIKFSEQGEVRLEIDVAANFGYGGKGQAGERAGRLRFTVADRGIGIAAGELGRLFQPFSQVDASATRRFGGTGLGLAIVRQLVGMMGGEMGVESRVGEGSLFWFELPLPLASLPMAEEAVAGEAFVVPLAGRPRVLLAEDSPTNRELAREQLAVLGCEVILAEDGRQAAARADQAGIDLILMDCQMPGLDGLAAARLIRSREKDGRRVPIIAVTANAAREDRENCLAAGMDDFLAKPYRQGQLAAIMSRWLGEDEVSSALPVLEPAVLRKMAALYPHDPAFAGRIVGIFQAEAEKRLGQIETALAQDDRDLLVRALHSLKSSSASLGAARLAAICRTLEEAARNGSRPADLAPRAASLPDEVAAVRAAQETLRN